MANEMVLRVPDEQLNAADAWRYILRLHLSYFADLDGMERFLEHIGKPNPFFDRNLELINTFGPENPRQPVECWGFLEPELRDLVARMTYLDPRGRVTAREALEHSWLGDFEGRVGDVGRWSGCYGCSGRVGKWVRCSSI